MTERESEKPPFTEAQIEVMQESPNFIIALGLVTSLNKGLSFKEAVKENRENVGADELYEQSFDKTVDHIRENSDKLGIEIENKEE